jgi:hypothetical protein
MAAQVPVWSIGDVVYLRESAAIGFLEAHAIAAIHILNGRIIYYMKSSIAPPPAIAGFGERITHQNRASLYWEESELISYCDALKLCQLNLQTQLAAIEAKLAGCPDSTE